MSTNKLLYDLARMYDVQLDITGKVDYAQCYEVLPDAFVIKIPETYSPVERIFAFCHELGHVLDGRLGKKFLTEWNKEVSAWRWSWELSKNHLKHYQYAEFIPYLKVCLTTYYDGWDESFDAAFTKALMEILVPPTELYQTC